MTVSACCVHTADGLDGQALPPVSDNVSVLPVVMDMPAMTAASGPAGVAQANADQNSPSSSAPSDGWQYVRTRWASRRLERRGEEVC